MCLIDIIFNSNMLSMSLTETLILCENELRPLIYTPSVFNIQQSVIYMVDLMSILQFKTDTMQSNMLPVVIKEGCVKLVETDLGKFRLVFTTLQIYSFRKSKDSSLFI